MDIKPATVEAASPSAQGSKHGHKTQQQTEVVKSNNRPAAQSLQQQWQPRTISGDKDCNSEIKQSTSGDGVRDSKQHGRQTVSDDSNPAPLKLKTIINRQG